MSGIINRLSELLANQIAAGEVVQSPSSVAKELLENSIDAGSSYVILSIKDGGKQSIQVIDDGKGMSADDALMAFERHATSKIYDIDDLFNIRTFGFRGEALSSISSVAEVELITRREEDELGTHVKINGGTLMSSEPVSHSTSGSQFIVNNLFYNIPARKKSLKKDITETKRIITEFQRVALCHSKVAFSLYADDKLLYMLSSTINMRQRITALMGKAIGNSILDLYVDTTIVEIRGYIGKPNIAKKRPDCFFFVNGRYFESPALYKAIQNGYDKLVPDGSLPPFFLHFTVEPSVVDVNITPTKTSVKFDEEAAIWQILNAAVRESLGKSGIMPMIDFSGSASDLYNVDIFNSQESKPSSSMMAEADIKTSIEMFNTTSDSFVSEQADAAEEVQSSYLASNFNPFDDSFSFSEALSGRQDSFKNSFNTIGENEQQSSYSPSFTTSTVDIDFEPLSSNLGQQKEEYSLVSSQDIDYIDEVYDDQEVASDTFNTPMIETDELCITDSFVLDKSYGLASVNSELFIFNISRVKYVVSYYKFLQRLGNREHKVATQSLIFPLEISLSATDNLVLAEQRENLLSLGFVFEKEPESEHILFTSIPADLRESDVNWFVEEILTSIKYKDALDVHTSHNELLAISAAKTLSRPANEKITNQEFEFLIKALFEQPAYNFTYDGRRVFVKITLQQITSLFK